MPTDDETFYIVQKALIKKGDEVLVLFDEVEGLDFPGGKIQVGDGLDPVAALKREVREETSLEITVGQPFTSWITAYPAGHERAGKKVFATAHSCEYISGDIVLSSEHTKFTWVTKNNFQKVNDGTTYFEALRKYFD